MKLTVEMWRMFQVQQVEDTHIVHHADFCWALLQHGEYWWKAMNDGAWVGAAVSLTLINPGRRWQIDGPRCPSWTQTAVFSYLPRWVSPEWQGIDSPSHAVQERQYSCPWFSPLPQDCSKRGHLRGGVKWALGRWKTSVCGRIGKSLCSTAHTVLIPCKSPAAAGRLRHESGKMSLSCRRMRCQMHLR